MPRLSQSDAELVVRCLELVLEDGRVDVFEEGARPIEKVVSRLRARAEQGRVAAALPHEARRQRRSVEAPTRPPRRPEGTK